MAGIKKLKILSPWSWAKVLASSIALYVNAIQLSEASKDDGSPAVGKRGDWWNRAKLVAFEGHQIRKHLGLIK